MKWLLGNLAHIHAGCGFSGRKNSAIVRRWICYWGDIPFDPFFYRILHVNKAFDGGTAYITRFTPDFIPIPQVCGEIMATIQTGNNGVVYDNEVEREATVRIVNFINHYCNIATDIAFPRENIVRTPETYLNHSAFLQLDMDPESTMDLEAAEQADIHDAVEGPVFQEPVLRILQDETQQQMLPVRFHNLYIGVQLLVQGTLGWWIIFSEHICSHHRYFGENVQHISGLDLLVTSVYTSHIHFLV